MTSDRPVLNISVCPKCYLEDRVNSLEFDTATGIVDCVHCGVLTEDQIREYRSEHLKLHTDAIRDMPIVSDEMTALGLTVYEDMKATCPSYLLVGEIYRAMLSARQDVGITPDSVAQW